MSVRSSYFRVAASITVLLLLGVAALLLLYRFCVNANRAAITQRDYRFLSAMSSELTSAANALLTALPQLQSSFESEVNSPCNPQTKTQEGNATFPQMVFAKSTDRLFVSLLCTGTPNTTRPLVDRDFGANLRSSFTRQNFFDLLMLAKSDGTIVYDASSSNVSYNAGLTSLTGLANAELRHKDDALRQNGLVSFLGDDQPSSFANVSAGTDWLGPGQYERVRYLADEYILFAVAVPVPSPEQYLLIGLVRAKRFDSEVATLPPGWVGGACTILFLIVFASPVAAVLFKNSRERLLKGDILILSFGILVTSMILTMVGLFCAWHFSSAWFFDGLTKGLSDQVTRQFRMELVADSSLLEKGKKVCSDRNFSIKEIPAGTLDFDREMLCADPRGNVNGIWSVNPVDSAEKKPEWRFSYENLKAPIFVGDRNYFKTALANVDQWTSENEGFSLEVVLSRRDGRVNLILASALDQVRSTGGKAEQLSGGANSGTLIVVSSKALPFREPVLPVGFSFAIIDEQGMVQFHSIPGREQAENFFEETNSDRNSALQAAVSARNGRMLDVNYYGRDERIYVGPVPNTPWFVVTMRDTGLMRYAESEAVLAWLYLIVLYLCVCVGAITFTRIASGRFGPIMLWPEREQGALYLRATLLFGVLTLAAFCSVWIGTLGTDAKFEVIAGLPWFSIMVLHLVLTSRERRFAKAVAIGIVSGMVGFILWAIAGQVILACVVVGLTIAPFDRWPAASKEREIGAGSTEAYFRAKYTSMLLALIVAVGITPSAIIFLDSAGRELEGVSRLAELRLFASMRNRTEKTRKDVQGFKVNQKNELLAERLQDFRDIYVMDPWLKEPQMVPDATACETFQKNDGGTAVTPADRDDSRLLIPFWDNLLLESPFSAELREVMFDAFPSETQSWHWAPPPHSFTVTDPTFLREMCLAAYQADFQPPPILNSKLTWSVVLTGLLVSSFFFLGLRKMAAALFLLDADSNPPVQEDAANSDFGKHWTDSSDEEKLALRHLAEDGFLSPPNTGNVRKLMSRGLILRNPSLSLFNEAFRAHLLNNVPEEEIRRLGAVDQRSGWSQLPAILAVPAIILLLLVYPGFVTTVAGAIGALTVALPQAQGLLRSFGRNVSSKIET